MMSSSLTWNNIYYSFTLQFISTKGTDICIQLPMLICIVYHAICYALSWTFSVTGIYQFSGNVIPFNLSSGTNTSIQECFTASLCP